MLKKEKIISAFSVLMVILTIILSLDIAAVIFKLVVLHNDDSDVSVFGYHFYQTMAVNMEPAIPKDTIIIAKESESDSIKAYSVILCRIGGYTVLTRVTEVCDDAYIVKFDTSPDDQTFRVESSDIIAKAVWQL